MRDERLEKLYQWIEKNSILPIPKKKMYDGVIGAFPLSASVFKVDGDTRLPEICARTVKSKDASKEVAYYFGVMAGAQKRILNSIAWEDNSHVGNYVIFMRGQEVWLSMVDFDGSIPERVNNIFIQQFIDLINSFFEKRWVMNSIKRRNQKYKKKNGKELFPAYFIDNFKTGFTKGFKDPDKRRPIDLELLCGAYDLS